MFQHRALRRIFGPKRDEIIGGWRKLHNEELHILYSSPNITGAIKYGRMRGVGHVARMGWKRSVHRVWWENQKEETTRRTEVGG
jgi:hypothetical protein